MWREAAQFPSLLRGLTQNQSQHSQFRGRRVSRPLRGERSAALAQLPNYQITIDENGEINQPESPLSLMGEGKFLLATGLEKLGEGVFEDEYTLTRPSVDLSHKGEVNTWLEIGFGSGEHLLAQALRHPEITFIGVEPFINGVSALLKNLADHDVTNVRVFTEDARFLLKTLPDHSVSRCFILFADPWPKKRHNKRRIVNAETLGDLARVLTPHGEIYLATDDPGLAEWYAEVVTAHPAFTLHPAGDNDPQIRPEEWPATRYEEKALAKGKAPFYYRVSILDKKP